jgi:hypothetical protein
MTRIEQIVAVSNKRAMRTKHAMRAKHAPVYTVDACVFRTHCRPNAHSRPNAPGRAQPGEIGHSSYPQLQRLKLWITGVFYLVNMVS